MRKFFTLILSVFFVFAAFAQDRPEGTIMQVGDNVPVIDGVLDDNGAWDGAIVYNIDKALFDELFTFGESGETTWRALWNDDGIYIFLSTVDDAWYPAYMTGGNSWEHDKPEIYFDVNYTLDDGGGPLTDGTGGGNGHYQVAPEAAEENIDGTPTTQDDGVIYAFKVSDPNWDVEYFVPWAKLLTGNGGSFDKTAPMGFDVTMIDRDPGDTGRRRAVWANNGTDDYTGNGVLDESWGNMDNVGYVLLDGAEPGIPVDEITLSVDGDITEDNQTLQINAVVEPEDADDPTVVYKILDGSTARATVSKGGLITPITNGVLIVGATDVTEFVDWDENAITINISGQVVTRFEVSYIKNGEFNVVDTAEVDGVETIIPGAPWGGGSTVADGVLSLYNKNGQGVNPWDWTVGQTIKIPQELKDDPFVLQLDMWISDPDTFDVDLELAGDDYLRFGNTEQHWSNLPENETRSQWRFLLTTEPTTYTLEINDFSPMDNRSQVFNLFAGLTENMVYVDNVSLNSKYDLDFVVGAKPVVNMETFSVYPNPASNQLHINLSNANTRVMIYNSVGIKMEETVVVGTHHVFDVSDYTPGMYFVKANNAVMKFMK